MTRPGLEPEPFDSDHIWLALGWKLAACALK